MKLPDVSWTRHSESIATSDRVFWSQSMKSFFLTCYSKTDSQSKDKNPS